MSIEYLRVKQIMATASQWLLFALRSENCMQYSLLVFVGCILAIVISTAITKVIRNYALCFDLLDHPNSRSSHVLPTPRGGGMATVLTFQSCVVLLWFINSISCDTLLILVGCGGAVALIGWWDDHISLPVCIRLGVHFCAVILTIYIVPELPILSVFSLDFEFLLLGKVILAFALVWQLNLFNFMDGIDGLAGSQAIFVALGAALILWLHGEGGGMIFLLLLLAGSTCGFLIWNWPPAKIFMGDSCSSYLGFCFGGLALITSAMGEISLWSWINLLSIFIVDSTVTLARRLSSGEKVYEAHRSHCYQILAGRWQSHKRVTLVYMLCNLLWSLPAALLVSFFSFWAASITFCAIFVPAMVVAWVGAGNKVH